MARDKAPTYKIVKDTREQKGWNFSPYAQCEGMIEQKLDTGDYTILGMEDYVCVERKASVEELAMNLGSKKRAFMNEIQRMKEFPHRVLVLEFSMQDVIDFPKGTDIPHHQLEKIKISGRYMMRCLLEFQIFDDIDVMFCGNKYNAFMYASSLFKRVNEKYTIGRQS